MANYTLKIELNLLPSGEKTINFKSNNPDTIKSELKESIDKLDLSTINFYQISIIKQ